ncbi:regulator [Lacisediminihabitans sp.]|jgi:MinD-like ATPase involved in chromosome partitioning or flagellar assembly|uniref:AAA family ATPase n=1 Tax=Lacisediminihabitans sp. TaxID=2787631 RepID=UPI002F95578C
MVRVALALPIDLEDRLAGELLRHGHDVVARCSSADELASVLHGATADVAIVAASPRYLNRRLLTESDASGVRIVAMAAADDERRNAATLDLREVVAASAAWPEIEDVMLGSGPTVGEANGSQRRGQVVAVWGPAGSPGRTTLAIALAAEIAAEGHTVALADVDTHSGSVAPALGLLDEAPGFAAACRLAGADSLTQRELERIGQRYLSPRGSFWVLTGIGRPSRWPELSAERVVGTIGACREWVDFTIVDTGSSLENDEEISSDLFAPRRNAATIAALREADQVVAIGSADPVGLSRFLRAHVDLVETIATDRVAVVMNKIRASAIGLNASSQVRQTLQRFGGISDPALVPYDRAALDAAVLSGRTLCDVAPKSAARVAIRQLARERVLAKPAPARGRFGRGADRRGLAAG